ncbi:MAG: LCP family protein [Patescibacteria group bacterium]
MEPLTYISPENPREPEPPRYSYKRILFFVAIALVFIILGSTKNHSISISNPFNNNDDGGIALPFQTPDPDYDMPAKESDRIDILIMGIRGENDVDADTGGPLLTDSIQLFSYSKTTGKSSLVSIPRDLYVTIHDNKKDKINSAYEYGLSHSSNSLKFIKEKISQITGVYVDQVVVFDFSSFQEIVDALGGVDVTLAVPFSESQQWGYAFSLPAGVNHLDGKNALYYARSRYSSSDFDRSRRQQQIIFAIKDKLLQLNFLSDPVKSFSILNLIRNDIKTDIGIWNIKQTLDLANEVKVDQIKRSVISTENFLIEGKENGSYVLTPKTGNFGEIKKFFQDILK